MRVAYLAAGAGGMYCGSCIHDNAAARAMIALGHEVALMPTYTPLKTDEENVSLDRVFYGAVNVYLDLKGPLFRRLPGFVHRWLDRPGLLRWVADRFAGTTDAKVLGELTLAVLAGEEGPQKRELDELVSWLRDDFRPDVVHVTNSLLLGVVREIKRVVKVPVVVAVQGEDIFLDDLTGPYRERVIAAMRERARDADLVLAPSRWYAAEMAALLDLPLERTRVVPLGIHLEGEDDAPARGAGGRLTIGYLARICPEKGLHLLLEAFRELCRRNPDRPFRLRIAGWVGARDRAYLDGQMARVGEWGLAERVELVGEVDHAGKARFLGSLDLLSVPTVYREPKGLFALEAMAHGVPVVLPAHGSFPEMIEATGGGLLVEPGSPEALATGLTLLLDDAARRRELGRRGQAAVRERFGDRTMAEATLAVYEEAIAGRS